MRALATVLNNRKEADDDSWFTAPVVAKWWDTYVAGGNMTKEFAVAGSRVRASWAGDCARAIAYHVAGTEESDPPTVADAWRFNIGTLLHEHIQREIVAAFPGSVIEVKVSFGTDGSGHMDCWVVHPDGHTTSVEIKTINGTGYRRMLEGEGLRVKYLVQASLNAYSHDPKPDELVVAVFSLECLSDKQLAKVHLEDEYRKFASQWTFSRDEYSAVAEEEIRRLDRIVELVDTQGVDAVPRKIPDPSLPARHRVVKPTRGLIEILDATDEPVGIGKVWQCDYCSFQSHCGEGM